MVVTVFDLSKNNLIIGGSELKKKKSTVKKKHVNCKPR